MAVVVFGVFKGCGENRSIIVFRDYDDLGLTFLVPASFFLITYIFTMLGGNQNIGAIIGGVVALILFIKLVINTFIDNGRRIGKCALSLITKLPLAIIWIVNFIQLLNPSGTGSQRSKNRGQALVIRTNTFGHFAKRVQSLNEVNNVNKE
ncbi:hypothetical protein, partial [Rheinheimera sp.]|uniref:hypothetical protein n=1 Tax=Rheinheimera sp. TaxID=1869214 RepID=UPI004047FC08